jgi:hypothetical protein
MIQINDSPSASLSDSSIWSGARSTPDEARSDGLNAAMPPGDLSAQEANLAESRCFDPREISSGKVWNFNRRWQPNFPEVDGSLCKLLVLQEFAQTLLHYR